MWHAMRWSPTGLLRERATRTEAEGINPLRNLGGLQQHLVGRAPLRVKRATPQCGFRIAERSAKKLLT